MPVDKFGNEVIRGKTIVKSDEGISLGFANNTYIRLDGENDITGNLNMDLYKIENLAKPTNPKDATNKEYVDNTKGSGVIGELKDETATLKGNLDFEGKYRLKNLPEPIDRKDGVNREFVNLRDHILKTELLTSDAFEFINNEYKAKQNLNMDNTFTLKNLMDPVDENDAVNRKYVDEIDKLNTAFIFRNNGYYAKGGIIMRKNKLGGLPQPINDGEAATKKYVDDTTKNLFIDENDNIAFGRDVDMEGNQILGLPEPATDQQPATKKYVDDLQTQHVDEKGNVKFGRNINLDRNRIFLMKEPTKPSEGANKKYVDETIDKRIQEEKDNFLPQDPATKHYVDEAIRGIAGGDVLVSKEGVFIKENGHYRATAPLDIDNQKVENIPDPVDETDAANKKYVDDVAKSLTVDEPLIRENGGYNIADAYINMNFNHIKNLAYPKNEADAVTRKFVQDVIRDVEEKIKKRKHLIEVHASYHGDLIKGDYQFTWAGQSMNSYKKHDMFSGFMVPSSGYIKKFVVFATGFKFNATKDRDIVEFIVNDLGYNNHIPFFTLVLIRVEQEPVDIGTVYFYFIDSGITPIGETKINFKFNPNFEEKTLRTIGARDIINIRSEFNSIDISGYRVFTETKGYGLKNVDDDFFTYHASVLIELDPIDD